MEINLLVLNKFYQGRIYRVGVQGVRTSPSGAYSNPPPEKSSTILKNLLDLSAFRTAISGTSTVSARRFLETINLISRENTQNALVKYNG